MECVICLSNVDTEYKLSCGHSFHENCIKKWMDSNNSCPICRKEIDCCTDPDEVYQDIMHIIKEIHNICDFKIRYRYLHLHQIKLNIIKARLLMIKNKLNEYNQIRSRGFSNDFLATDIGYLVNNINNVLIREHQ